MSKSRAQVHRPQALKQRDSQHPQVPSLLPTQEASPQPSTLKRRGLRALSRGIHEPPPRLSAKKASRSYIPCDTILPVPGLPCPQGPCQRRH